MSGSIPRKRRTCHSGPVPFWQQPARRPYAFWIPTLFVFIAGSLLATRNYLNHSRQTNLHATAMAVENEIVSNQSDAVVEPGSSSVSRLCLSLAIVALASVIAGFSIAHLLNRTAVGFHSVEQAERSLPIPVLGAVPIA